VVRIAHDLPASRSTKPLAWPDRDRDAAITSAASFNGFMQIKEMTSEDASANPDYKPLARPVTPLLRRPEIWAQYFRPWRADLRWAQITRTGGTGIPGSMGAFRISMG